MTQLLKVQYFQEIFKSISLAKEHALCGRCVHLGVSTSLIVAVGFILLTTSCTTVVMLPQRLVVFVTQFSVRVSIAISIDFVFNPFSVWLQMSYLNIAVVRVSRKKWRKHMLIAFILTAVTLCYFTTHLFAVGKDKNTSGVIAKGFSQSFKCFCRIFHATPRQCDRVMLLNLIHLKGHTRIKYLKCM